MLLYNDLLKHFGAENTEPIRNKDKIRWAYMKKNPLGIDALAFKGYDDPKQITDFKPSNVVSTTDLCLTLVMSACGSTLGCFWYYQSTHK